MIGYLSIPAIETCACKIQSRSFYVSGMAYGRLPHQHRGLPCFQS
jgi:hypothetical protein